MLAAASTATTQPTRLPLQLLSYFLKLLTDYRTVEAIDGYVKPIAFFAFQYEVSRTSAASPINEGERMKVRGFRRERPAA